jgi:hypothetical protein
MVPFRSIGTLPAILGTETRIIAKVWIRLFDECVDIVDMMLVARNEIELRVTHVLIELAWSFAMFHQVHLTSRVTG